MCRNRRIGWHFRDRPRRIFKQAARSTRFSDIQRMFRWPKASNSLRHPRSFRARHRLRMAPFRSTTEFCSMTTSAGHTHASGLAARLHDLLNAADAYQAVRNQGSTPVALLTCRAPKRCRSWIIHIGDLPPRSLRQPQHCGEFLAHRIDQLGQIGQCLAAGDCAQVHLPVVAPAGHVESRALGERAGGVE